MRRPLELALVALVAGVVGVVAYRVVGDRPHASAAAPEPGVISIPAASFRISGTFPVDENPLPLTFEVTGGGEVDVTYFPGPGGETIKARVTTPWQVGR
jgi:hypothetical protein